MAPLWLTAAGGALAGALIGARGLSFAQYTGALRRNHQIRAGITFGAIGAALATTAWERWAASHNPLSNSPHFWWDKTNTPLLAAMAGVQVLDYTGTRYFRQRGRNEWLLTNQLVDRRSRFVATELSALGAAVGIAWVLHITGHPKLQRWFESGYVTAGAVSAISNYHLGATGHTIY